MKKALLYYVAMTLLVINLEAKEHYNVDLLIKYALKHSPDIQITSKEYEASFKETTKAAAYFLPRIDIHASAGATASSEIIINPENIAQDTLLLGKITLSQLVYDFGKSGGHYDASKYMQESYNMNNLQKIADKMRDVKSAYYNLLRSMALINVAKENLKLNEAQLYRSKKYYTAGIRTKIDISDAKVNVIKAKIELKKVKYRLKLAYTKLDQVIGSKEIDSPYTIQAQNLNLDDIFATLTPYEMNLYESVGFAYEHRYIIQKLIANQKASKQNIRVAKSQYYPSIYLNANYTRLDADTLNTFLPKDTWQASVNVDWNLYQGGSSKALIEQRIIQENISQAQLEFLKLEIKKDVTEAYLNLNESKDRVELSEALLQAAMEKFHQAQKRYENGLSDYIELQQARQSYIDSKSSLVVDYYNYYDALATMYHAIGK
jgi:outer membrane protein